MNGKKLLLAGLSATLLVGAAAQASFAAPQGNDGRGGRWHGPGFSPEIAYVRMLKQFDTNGDMKITKDEVKAGVDKIFDQIDTNHDGQITPGELRAYRQDQIKQWKAERAKADDKDQADQDQAGKPQGDQPDDQAASDQAQNDDHKGGDGRHGHHRHGGGRFMRDAALFRETMLFHRIDKDENGQISKQEAEDAANKLFDRMDRNHDGVISLDDMPNRPFL